MSSIGELVQLCWIPSHVGIAGKELVDAAAKRAALDPSTRRLPLPAHDFYPAISLFLHAQWQRKWVVETRKNLKKLKSIIRPWLSRGGGCS